MIWGVKFFGVSSQHREMSLTRVGSLFFSFLVKEYLICESITPRVAEMHGIRYKVTFYGKQPSFMGRTNIS